MDRCRATTSTGAVIDRPSRSQLADLFAEVERSGRDGFLVLERGAASLQARRTPDGWLLEANQGMVRRVHAETADAALVCSVFAYWVLRSRPFPGLRWRPELLAAV